KRGNIISHNSSNGKSFAQRLQEAGKYACGAENVYVGSNKALESLITLLIDNGVPDKGHRMNLLDPRYGRMGVSLQNTGSGKGLLVQDFACP
ncbi:MAG TPA: CAP domain-containing protein, partial [Lacibacter sp.]|nr:CAP domain-containing protein [Lacibacter sp.]